jgi:alcohol dehydrogenase (cytochrome c)/quinohemoprotein ethanol dehydrogenase
LLLSACGQSEPPAPVSQSEKTAEPSGPDFAVNASRITAADQEPGNWLSHGRSYDEQRFSPLKQINSDNAADLGLEWIYEFDTRRGLEATPIVVDGVMFTTGAWSQVFALDARSGELLWKYDPEVPGEWAVHACCDVVNRGVAIWEGSVFVGTLDGRLVSLDARTGKVNWTVLTIDKSKPYTITGAPRVVNGKVVIGNGGAEYGVRGYVSAYSAETGAMAWRFYTVPGNPAEGFESEVMEKAAETWTGEWWTMGGGGTVWDSMAFDPELNLLYIGVGNGSPWNQQLRSPGGGDNLFLSSIVALDADTGKYVWHYQTTPGETWDYTATQHMILTELEIDGRERKVLLQAPKNGFFYVLDRENGRKPGGRLKSKACVTSTSRHWSSLPLTAPTTGTLWLTARIPA